MSSFVNVAIHASQFPDQVWRDLLESLRNGQVNHKFHYDSVKQAAKWLALHRAYSPSRTDPDCVAIYERSFEAVAEQLAASGAQVHVIGLGCGAGQKDSRLLQQLAGVGRELFYTPSDVSTALVLMARQTALSILPACCCRPLVCDLASAADLPLALEKLSPFAGAVRVFTFFGMIPNFEPQIILPRLANLLRQTDVLLFSANLAPGQDYASGVQRVLPLYDNALTRDWLMTFLYDLGVEAGDGQLNFGIEEIPASTGLKRIAAHFKFLRCREIPLADERLSFSARDSIRVFFSYRHTPKLVQDLLAQYGMRVRAQWVSRSEEEGVFLVSKSA